EPSLFYSLDIVAHPFTQPPSQRATEHNPHRSRMVIVKHNFTTTTTTTTTSTSTEESDLVNNTVTPLDIGGLVDDMGTEHMGGGSKKKALQEFVSNLSTSTTTSSTSSAAVFNTTLIDSTTKPTTIFISTSTTVPPPTSTQRPKYSSSWLQPRWPFADPSSYFQWTGYNGRDSLLLPLILGAALFILLLTICICYSIRRRRQKKLRRQTIGKISTDLQCGDKTTLLPDGSEEE
ncbi:hypothetical protein L9F63_006041, partial [Diploptera punctata]